MCQTYISKILVQGPLLVISLSTLSIILVQICTTINHSAYKSVRCFAIILVEQFNYIGTEIFY